MRQVLTFRVLTGSECGGCLSRTFIDLPCCLLVQLKDSVTVIAAVLVVN